MKRLLPLLLLLFPSALLATPNGVQTVSWSTLKTLSAKQVHSAAQALDNQTVSVPGFMVPLEDDADQVTEFLLVPYAGACIHVPPPPPNQMIYVKIRHNGKVKMSFTEPIVVAGQLHVRAVQSPYGSVSFNMDADSVRPYDQ